MRSVQLKMLPIYDISYYMTLSVIPNSAPHTHTHTPKYGPNKICTHTTEPTRTMYFNWLF